MTERIQKEMEPGWDPHANAHHCIGLLNNDLKRCDVSSFIAHTGCVFGNAEAAFYEKDASEDEMNSLKETAADLRHKFVARCTCSKK